MPLIESYGKSQEALNALNASLPEKLRQSILQEAIQGHLVPQDPNEEPASVLLERIRAEKARLVKEGKLKKKDLEEKPISPDEIPFDIPEGWVWCRLSDIAYIVMGQSPEGDSINRQSGTEFHQGKIAYTNYLIGNSGLFTTRPSKIAAANSLLMCVRAPIGNINVVDREICIGRGLCAIQPFYDFNIKFWFYFLSAFKTNLESKGTGSTFKAITISIVNDLIVPLPPLSEQRRIVTKLEELLQEIDKLKA